MNASLVLIVMSLPKMLVLTGRDQEGLDSTTDTLGYSSHFSSPTATKNSGQRRATGEYNHPAFTVFAWSITCLVLDIFKRFIATYFLNKLQWRIQGFPEKGVDPSGEGALTYYLAYFLPNTPSRSATELQPRLRGNEGDKSLI